MDQPRHYFFCGIGGSGMLPLAMILVAQGHRVEGSDRALDQGRTLSKFDYLRANGITLHRQDGSGLTSGSQILVASAAVEEAVPDVAAALANGSPRITRAELLASLFNDASCSIAIGGTSGKSTTTGMVGWILHHAGHSPTVVNGAVMKNFVSSDAPFASAVLGEGEAFVSEVDESDGSIALFSAEIAVLNNISHDHKTMEELRELFADFVSKADIAILNRDDEEVVALAKKTRILNSICYGIENEVADLIASDIKATQQGVEFSVLDYPENERVQVKLAMPGRHNVSNALAAIAAAQAAGVSLDQSAAALNEFAGIKRRTEVVGTAGDITIIDDFGHNPDKIAATLSALHAFPGRLLVMFQPHGFGPLRLMRKGFVVCFDNHMAAQDVLLMPDPVYFGGTTNREVTSKHIASDLGSRGKQAIACDTREECGAKLLELAQPGDRIIIMGARDDTLSDFAAEILAKLKDQVR